jgi:hypothetical protein
VGEVTGFFFENQAMHTGSIKVKPGKNEWRTGPDDTLQVVNPKSKEVKVIFYAHH